MIKCQLPGLCRTSSEKSEPRVGAQGEHPSTSCTNSFSNILQQQSLKGLWESASIKVRDEGGAFYKRGTACTVAPRKQCSRGDCSPSQVTRAHCRSLCSALVAALAHQSLRLYTGIPRSRICPHATPHRRLPPSGHSGLPNIPSFFLPAHSQPPSSELDANHP